MDSKPVSQVAPFDQGAYLIVDLLELGGNCCQRVRLEGIELMISSNDIGERKSR